MAFCHRVFCRRPSLPIPSTLLLDLQRAGHAVRFAGGRASDLVEPLWARVQLATPDEPPFQVERLQPEVGTAVALAEELADFRADVAELPPSDGRAAITALLSETRAIVRVSFPADGLGPRGETAVEALCDLLAETTDGLVQRDGEGFFDEAGDEVLALG